MKTFFLLMALSMAAHAGPYTELRRACERDSRLLPRIYREEARQVLCENVTTQEETNLVIACLWDQRIEVLDQLQSATLCQNIKTLENLQAVIHCYANQTFRGDNVSVAMCSRVQHQYEIEDLVQCYKKYKVGNAFEALRCR